MRNIVDSVEERAGELPLRHVKSFDMDEITLALNRIPVYSATSVEVRAEEDGEVEERATLEDIEFVQQKEDKPEDVNAAFRERLKKLEN